MTECEVVELRYLYSRVIEIEVGDFLIEMVPQLETHNLYYLFLNYRAPVVQNLDLLKRVKVELDLSIFVAAA